MDLAPQDNEHTRKGGTQSVPHVLQTVIMNLTEFVNVHMITNL